MSSNHHCPGCGVELKTIQRYPWRFCSSCLDTAHDVDERPIQFTNADLSGGLVWFYRDEPHQIDDKATTVYCLIRHLPVIISEGRFGGVVAQPWPSYLDFQTGPKTANLCFDSPALKDAKARLMPIAR